MQLAKEFPVEALEPTGRSTGEFVGRHQSLDLLRGICALGVVVYHFVSWGNSSAPPILISLFSFLGLYGVSIFFMVSGYSLTLAYASKFDSGVSAEIFVQFLKRRIGRLLPLFFLVTVISVAGKLLVTHKPVDLAQVMGSLLLIFGLVDPTRTPVVGGWSIGVEVVFYLAFPLVYLLRRKWYLVIFVSVLLTLLVTLELVQFSSIQQGNSMYVSPANHFVFFALGVFMRTRMNVRKSIDGLSAFILFAFCLCVAAVIGLDLTELQRVTGWRRLLFVCLSASILLIFIALKIRKINPIAQLAGKISYPLYLLHPIIYFSLAAIVPFQGILKIVVVGLLSILAALIVERFYDRPIQKKLIKALW